ncbi:hypothetical protein HDV00_011817 [Rhizophlyctis rosea]|nr:hypothetical protein HDV00_011817 [Rhizophlyctis rosea]
MASPLPAEMMLKVARLSGPYTSRKFRRTCKGYAKLITLRDVAWAEAGWRHHEKGLDQCWQWAFRHWHTEILTAYLPDVSQDCLFRALHHAAHRGDLSILEPLLTTINSKPAPANPDTSNSDEEEPETPVPCPKEKALREALYLAVRQRHSAVVKTLLQNGATDGALQQLPRLEGINLGISWLEGLKPTILHLAVSLNEVEIVQALLNVKPYDRAVLTSILYETITQRTTVLVPLLINAGADVQGAPLNAAAQRGLTYTVKLLLVAGSDAQAFDNEAFITAARNGHVAAARMLLDAGADVHARMDEAINSAVSERHEAVITLLIRRGVSTAKVRELRDLHRGDRRRHRW